MFKKLFSISFIALVVLTNSGCSKCPVALADLAVRIVLDAAITVVTGVPLTLGNTISNIGDFADECRDEVLLARAGASNSFVQINIYNSSTGQYQPCPTLDCAYGIFSLPSIDPYTEVVEQYAISFSEPGDYQVITFADYTKDVEEWNEGNNGSNSIDLRSASPCESVCITVLPNPNYQRQPGAPLVSITREGFVVRPISR